MQQPPQDSYTQYPPQPYQQPQTGPGIPPPPQYYPTGGLPPQYPPPPPPPSIWHRKFGCAPVWLIVLICGIFMVGGLVSYASNGKSAVLTGAQIAATNSAQLAATNAADCASNPSCTSNTTPVPTATIDTSIPTSTPAPTQPPAKWRTTHSYSGSGDKQTGVISVPDDWKISWTCDGRNTYGVGGVIYIEVYNSDGTPSSAGDVSGNCAANKITADSTEEHQGGDIYLKVLAGVPWTIQIQEFK